MTSIFVFIPCIFGSLGGGEIVLIALVVLLLFGGRKIPELMRGLGKGMRSFKEGMRDASLDADDAPGTSADKDRGEKA